jgi:CheY-like chemotaxis protein
MLRFLIAEDDQEIASAIRDLLASRFEEHRHSVTLTSNGELALWEAEHAAARGKPYDLIISDWSMPRVTGIEFLRKVRAHPLLARSRFILLTAVVTKSEVVEAIAAGVTSYVTKPLAPSILLAKIDAALALSA